MSDPKTSKAPSSKPRRWWPRIWRTFLVLFLLVAIFHRPLFHAGLRLLLIQVAARQNITLQVHFSGTIFSDFTVEGVHALPTGSGPTPVRKIDIERVHLEYSLVKLLRRGVGEFLRSYEIKNADLVFEALPSRSEEERKQKKSLAEDLNNLLGQPALYADRVQIRNFNIAVHAEKSVTEIRDFNLILDPEKPGILHLTRLAAPGAPLWENLEASTSYRDRNLVIRGLQLAPELVFDEINFDASQRAQNKGATSITVRAFGGTFHLSLAGEQLQKKGENLAKSYSTILRINVENVSLQKAASYFGAPKPPVEKLENFALVFQGEPEKPRTWRGRADAAVQGIGVDQRKIDRAELALVFADGAAELKTAQIGAGENHLGLTGKIALPASVNHFPESEIDAVLEIAVPNLGNLTGMFGPRISGQVKGGGPVSLHAGKAQADLVVTAEKISNAQMAIASAAVNLKAARRLAPASGSAPTGPLEGLTSELQASLSGLRIQTFALDSAKLEIGNLDQRITLRSLEIRRGENAISAHGTYDLPTDLKQVATSPADLDISVALPKLESFGVRAKNATLSGHLQAGGSVKTVAGTLVGGMQIQGGDFRLGEFVASKLDADLGLENGQATIRKFTLQINPTDHFDLLGHAAIQPPFSYESELLVGFKDLASLQPLLAVFGVRQTIGGGLQISWKGRGDPATAGAQAGLIPLPTDAAIASARSAPANVAQPPNNSAQIGSPTQNPAAFSSEALSFNLAQSPLFPAPLWLRPRAAVLAHSGALSVILEHGRVDKLDLSQIHLVGKYGRDFVETSELLFVTGQTSFKSSLELREGRLRLRDLNLQQGAISVLTGFLTVPVDLEHPAQPVPLDGRIAANINAANLDIEKLLTSFGQTTPATGTINANLLIGGTPLNPVGTFRFSGQKLKAKAPAAAGVEPADFDLNLHYADKDLTLESTLRQPQIQPLTVRGHAPFDLEKTLQTKKIDPLLPLDFHLALPTTQLAPLTKFAPQLRRLEGTLGLNVRVAGTVEKPVLSGDAAADLKEARLVNENVPAIGAFQARLVFANDTLNFQTFQGEVGGGKFKLGGTIKLPKLPEPVFDLRLQADEVLVKRDDSITVRADTDIKVTGPLKAGTVSGALYITHSRFFKEIDILPFAIPGKPKPVPRAVHNTDMNVSFPQPPLRDWKFDLAIKTRPNDSFLVRGNLANGGAAIDLKLAGTGLAPYLEGNIRIEDFVATLPFSKLTISRGFVYFSKDAPFQPSLDLQADSQLRDYLVHAYIYGKAVDPQVQLSSEPPLQYSDIVSLLATGTTASEIAGNSSALASRAAVLAVQQLYRKIFKKGATPEQKSDVGTFLDRFQFELGALDNRTGGQQVNSRFKVNDQLYLIGDVGVDGRFTGSFKYLIRFR